MNNDASGKRFLSGVTALTLSTALVKIIGLVYKIPMMHSLGAEGMGYFNSAYELYSLFFVIATAGLPVAVSVLISESLAHGRLRNAKKIYGVSFALFFVMGLAGALAMCFGAGLLAKAVGSYDSRLCISFLAPAVFLISIASAVRGYFQGNRNMIPTAVSQVVEALSKLILGLILAVWAIRAGWSAPRAAALAVLGIVAGTAISALYLLFVKMRTPLPISTFATDLTTDGTRRILWQLMALAIPVTVSASLSSLTRVVDMTMILRRLRDVGVQASKAAAMFGSYSTLAVPIYHLPSSLISGIAVSLVPSLTDAVESGGREKESELLRTALRLCFLISVPCALGLSLFSRPILELLFSGQTEPIGLSTPLLSVLGLSVPASCLATVTSAVLQARKKAAYPIVSMLAGLAVKVVVAYFLIGIPSVGMMGAPISTLLCNLLTVGLNFYFMQRMGVGADGAFSVFLKPLAASVVSMAAAVAVYIPLVGRTTHVSAFLPSLGLCGVVYLISAVKLGAVLPEDAAWLPSVGKRIQKITIKQKKGNCNEKPTSDPRTAGKETIRL